MWLAPKARRAPRRDPGATRYSQRARSRGPFARARPNILIRRVRNIGWTKQHEGGNAEEVEAADARLALARMALADVEALEDDPEVSPADFARGLSKARKAVAEAEEVLAGLDPTESTVRFLTPLGTREVFDALSIPEQRQVLHGVIEKVTLSTGKGSAEERLMLEFKDGTVVSKAERDARQAEIARQIAEAVAAA